MICSLTSSPTIALCYVALALRCITTRVSAGAFWLLSKFQISLSPQIQLLAERAFERATEADADATKETHGSR